MTVVKNMERISFSYLFRLCEVGRLEEVKDQENTYETGQVCNALCNGSWHEKIYIRTCARKMTFGLYALAVHSLPFLPDETLDSCQA